MRAMEHQLDRADYAALIEARVRAPESLQSALKGRIRRELIGDDGNLLIVAVDHTARGMLAAGSDPLAVADRYTLLGRVMRALRVPGVDGVMASADILARSPRWCCRHRHDESRRHHRGSLGVGRPTHRVRR